tara:strand:- start:40850 stop:41833 length:984 start_codon:yes stop_codon:yes gene_type:complete
MNLFITFDYELFFGDPTGSAEKCILEPTQRLIEIGERTKTRFTFFIDIGYVIQLEKWSSKFENLSLEYKKVVGQIKTLQEKGHDLQLHIHPHWETASYTNNKWSFKLDGHYKLADFNDEEIQQIVSSYKSKLESIIGSKVNGFRAGGWCLQPFNRFVEIFKKAGIKIDSTVFQGGKMSTKHYYFDFTNAPSKGRYRFDDNLCQEVENGSFLELPIGGYRYKPGFFWRLYILGRLMPRRHKMIGDGNFIAQGGKKYESLKKPIWDHVSCDGYYSSKLNLITSKFSKEGRSDLVIIGHPKSMTRYSFEQLEKYIRIQQKKNSFLTLSAE